MVSTHTVLRIQLMHVEKQIKTVKDNYETCRKECCRVKRFTDRSIDEFEPRLRQYLIDLGQYMKKYYSILFRMRGFIITHNKIGVKYGEIKKRESEGICSES